MASLDKYFDLVFWGIQVSGNVKKQSNPQHTCSHVCSADGFCPTRLVVLEMIISHSA